jgi:hypothetical protein
VKQVGTSRHWREMEFFPDSDLTGGESETNQEGKGEI